MEVRGAKRRNVIAVVNRAAGRAGPKTVPELEAILDAAGISKAEILSPEPAGLRQALSQAVSARPDLLILIAGDGTARLAAELCGPDGPLLAPLPGGTMNMLPRAIYGEATWQTVLADILVSGAERAIGGGEIGGRTFYCAAMMGATARFAPAREAVRSHRLGKALTAAHNAYRRAFAGRVRFSLADGLPHRAQSLTLLCPLISKALDSDATALEVAAIDPANAAEAMRISARVVLSSLIGDWRDDPAVHIGYAGQGRVWARHAIPALLDGEPTSLGRNAEFRFRVKAFRALAPQLSAEERL